MVEVYSSKSNAIRLTIDARGPLLAVFKDGPRRKIVKNAMTTAGLVLVAKFWWKRFTNYVQRKPFGYPKRAPKLAAKKLRNGKSAELTKLWDGFKERTFYGWDPWGHESMPPKLIQYYAEMNKGAYRNTVEERKRMYADLRRWAKKKSMEYASNLFDDGFMLPLVESGTLRDSAMTKTKVRSTVKATYMAECKISTPRAGRQNKLAVHILGTLPSWEFDTYVKSLDQALEQELTGDRSKLKRGYHSAAIKQRSPGELV